MRFLALFLCLAIFAFSGFNSLSAAEKYQLINIGVLDYSGSEITSINNEGQACGVLVKGSHKCFFTWEKDKGLNYKVARYSMNPVVNNLGDVYGSYWNRVERGLWELDQETICKWANPFSYWTYFNFHNVGYPFSQHSNGYHNYRAAFWDVNDLGQILVMDQGVVNWQLKYQIWVVDNNEWKKIDHLKFQAAKKINNHSQILGYFFQDNPDFISELETQGTKQKLFKAAIYDFKSGETKLLPIQGESFAFDLNDLGVVTGVYFDEKETLKGFVGNTESIQTIENLYPSAMNNQGQIVGETIDDSKLVIWDKDHFVYLDTAVSLTDDKGLVWSSLDILRGINDRGEIIGQGVYQDKTHGFMLIPIE